MLTVDWVIKLIIIIKVVMCCSGGLLTYFFNTFNIRIEGFIYVIHKNKCELLRLIRLLRSERKGLEVVCAVCIKCRDFSYMYRICWENVVECNRDNKNVYKI